MRGNAEWAPGREMCMMGRSEHGPNCQLDSILYKHDPSVWRVAPLADKFTTALEDVNSGRNWVKYIQKYSGIGFQLFSHCNDIPNF